MSIPFTSAFDTLEKNAVANPAQIRLLREELFNLRTRIRQHVDGGLPPSEIDAARGLLVAAETAEAVVGTLVA
jgi:hypothetical protein